MTRDKASDLIFRKFPGTMAQAGLWADLFSELGMLKLDEPQTVESKFREAFSHLSKPAQCSADNVWEIIHNSGLQIVEK